MVAAMKALCVAGVAVLVVLSACGSERKTDDCAMVSKRLLPYLSRDGATLPMEDVQRLLDRCQRREPGSGDDALFRCVAKAKDDSAVASCVGETRTVVNVENEEAPAPAEPARTWRDRYATSEVELQLARIKTNAKAAFNTDSAYPMVTAPLTPATPCCEQPGRRCQPKTSDWSVPAWQIGRAHV
jgi:hypothetical protein